MKALRENIKLSKNLWEVNQDEDGRRSGLARSGTEEVQRK